MGEKIGAYKVLWENRTKGDRYEDPRVDGRLILKFIFNKWGWGMD
jgi:hypothetical protein